MKPAGLLQSRREEDVAFISEQTEMKISVSDDVDSYHITDMCCFFWVCLCTSAAQRSAAMKCDMLLCTADCLVF